MMRYAYWLISSVDKPYAKYDNKLLNINTI